MGAIDFAGGTVVHINAGIAALVGALVVGPRVGFGKDNMAPHSMTLTMVGAAMLWVGWFGFNAGSNLEASGGAALAMINTFVATAGAILAWCADRGDGARQGVDARRRLGHGRGPRRRHPGRGFIGPVGAIVLGAVASAVCYFFVAVVKHQFGYDDSLDVFGVHGVGGIVGAIGTGIFASPSLGGTGFIAEGVDDGRAGHRPDQGGGHHHPLVRRRLASSSTSSSTCIVGLRVRRETEREGLDLAEHGERAYAM